MRKPLSSRSLINFLQQAKFDPEPIYIKTPEGYILEATKMAFMTLDDEESVYPVLLTQYTDIAVDIESSLGEPGSELPPS